MEKITLEWTLNHDEKDPNCTNNMVRALWIALRETGYVDGIVFESGTGQASVTATVKDDRVDDARAIIEEVISEDHQGRFNRIMDWQEKSDIVCKDAMIFPARGLADGDTGPEGNDRAVQ